MMSPTLLVGLGGTGSKIVQKVYNRLTKKQMKSVSCVIFDTDVNELREIQEKTPKIRVIQISTNQTVGEYLNSDTYARDNWFPVNMILNRKAMTEGAGQVRAISRLALNTSIKLGKMNTMNEAIEQLYKLNGIDNQQAVHVILVGSLCGGTGSGLTLPVSLYIRNYLQTKLQQSSAIIRGFMLLPEVFYKVIPSQSEQNNLKCNAYAALRELDAFQMKGDGSLPKKYDLHFFAPRAGSEENEEYDGLPMDFCFLFDAQNIDGKKLESFAKYLDHAANCIYAQAVAPTSKRSNSSEDNVIRGLAMSGGRNRYCGAGSAMLIYPVDDVLKYLSLCWAKKSISDEWLKIDRKYISEMLSVRARREKGTNVPEINRGEHYVQCINQDYLNRDAFSSSIRNLCYKYKGQGFVEEGPYWDKYIVELDDYIDKSIEESKNRIGDIKTECLQAADGAGRDKSSEAFNNWYDNLQGYKTAILKCTMDLARNLSYDLCKDETDYTGTEEKFRIEYWFSADSKKFLHPNAIRYFLYNAISTLKKANEENSRITGEILDYWRNFNKLTFDDAATEDVVEGREAYMEKADLDQTGPKAAIGGNRKKAAIANLTEQYGTFYTNCENYWAAYVKKEVYDSLIKYMEKLSESFHEFYDTLGNCIGKIDRQLEDLERMYVIDKDGDPLRYVCADKVCLQGLSKSVVNLGSSLDLPSEMTKKIYASVKEFAQSEVRPEAEKYFIETYKETILGYLSDQVMSQHRSEVDMDIITALEREGTFENPNLKLDPDGQELYAKRVIESAEVLARPFIEAPVGKEARIISACTYNDKLEKADFPGRKDFVMKYLGDKGGFPDDSIDSNMIIFYQSIYELRANNLSKFAPSMKEETYTRPGGEYFTAYYELVNKINPDPLKSKVITPHIDRWWHIITKLPDLDEGNQRIQENKIYSAFFWGLLGNYVILRQDGREQKNYHLKTDELGMAGDSEAMIVSNGTPCDHLYEVLDAFSIYPELVDKIMQRTGFLITYDKNSKTPVDKGLLMRYISNFRIQEYRLDENNSVRSIFDIPMLMKKSVPADIFDEEEVINILKNELTEIERYLREFCDDRTLLEKEGTLIREQFDRFLTDVEIESQDWKEIYSDSVFDRTCSVIAKKLDDMEFRTEAEYVRSKAQELGCL
jgi:hypothetical protein